MNDPIDAAFKKLEDIAKEVGGLSSTIASESDTRLKVLDRILTSVLGWHLADIGTSERAGSGFVDYVLRISNSSRVILEAKKDGIPFGFEHRHSGEAYKLNGPVFGPAAKE